MTTRRADVTGHKPYVGSAKRSKMKFGKEERRSGGDRRGSGASKKSGGNSP